MRFNFNNNIVTVTRKTLDGTYRSMQIIMDRKTFMECLYNWTHGKLIQDAFPTLNANQREFLMSGIAPDQRSQLFGTDNKDDYNQVMENKYEWY